MYGSEQNNGFDLTGLPEQTNYKKLDLDDKLLASVCLSETNMDNADFNLDMNLSSLQYCSNSIPLSSLLNLFDIDKTITTNIRFLNNVVLNEGIQKADDIYSEVIDNEEARKNAITLSGDGLYTEKTSADIKYPELSAETDSDSFANLDYVNRVASFIFEKLNKKIQEIHAFKQQIKPSFLGQVIHSSTLDTLEKVKENYGQETHWIQHTGYSLHGSDYNSATCSCPLNTPENAVLFNSKTKDGGDNALREIPLLRHSHTVKHSHSVTTSQSTSVSNRSVCTYLAADSTNIFKYSSSSDTPGWSAIYASSGRRLNGTVSFPSASMSINDSGSDDTKVSIMQPYKYVYIWERVK